MKEKELQLGQPIQENEFYYLCVAQLPDVPIPCYAVVSKKYGVVEMSTSILANAKKFLETLYTWEKEPPKEEENSMNFPEFNPGQLS